MDKFNLVPRVLDEVPQEKIEVEYADGVVDNGNEFKPGNLREAPLKISWAAEQDKLYTLVLFDPDPSENPQVRHWLVINIPGTDVENGDIVSSYTGPKPPGNTGIKAYIFAVFQQEEKLPCEPRADTQPLRHGFDIRKYAESHNLGKAIAWNFFSAQADEYSLKFWADKAKAEQAANTA